MKKDFKVTINKELVKGIGDKGLRLGKAVVVAGVKSLAVQTATKAITTGFDKGVAGVKEALTFDAIVGAKKEKTEKTETDKKKWFSKKGKTEEPVGESQPEVEVTVGNDSKESVIDVEATEVDE